MPIEIFYKNDHCEWIDVESPTEEDLAFLHQRYDINSLLLEDTIDANHLPKYAVRTIQLKYDQRHFYQTRYIFN